MQSNFLRNLKATNPRPRTIENIEYVLKSTNEFIKKPLESADWDDLLGYIEHLQSNGLKHSTIALHKSKLKQFYLFCFDETDKPEYRKIAKRLSDTIEKKVLDHRDLLTPEDVKRVLNVASHEQERAIVSSLFESGMRVGELLNLRIKDVQLDDIKQEVVFHIPDLPGSKTGSRSVLCVEIYGYITDWLKCHPNPSPNERFIEIGTGFGISQMLKRLYKRAGIDGKPNNPHIIRHSAITHAVGMGMQETAMKDRFWGNVGSTMLTTYIHLNEQMKSNAYKNAKGLGNGNGNTVINPLAVRCVKCGRLIQSGDLCEQCAEIKKVKTDYQSLKAEHEDMKRMMEEYLNIKRLESSKL